MRGIAFGIAVVVFVVTAPLALACGFDQVSIRQAAQEADSVVLGTVVKRVGAGTYTYTLDVERVIRGRVLPSRWVIKHAGVSDCGMPILVVGERVVLEYYEPGRKTTGPWFYAWKINARGAVAFSDSHLPPLPKTLDDLLARYAAAPDTATRPAGSPTSPTVPTFLILISLAALWISWRRIGRRGSRTAGDWTASP